MGRSPCCDENGLKKGPWTPEEDQKLVHYIQKHGHGSWRALPKLAGLNRCGKSCRLRWTNYLRPDIKRGKFSQEEEQTILHLHSILGNKWSAIASNLPGRTDNEIKNFWNTHLKKKLIQMGFDPMTHQPRTDLISTLPYLLALANMTDLLDHHHHHQFSLDDQAVKLQAEAVQLAKLHYLLQSTNHHHHHQNNYSYDHQQNGMMMMTNMEAMNLLNSISNNNVKENNPGLNYPQLQVDNIASSQPLHQNQSMLLSHHMEDPQGGGREGGVPFSSSQSCLNNNNNNSDNNEVMQGGGHQGITNFEMISQLGDIIHHHHDSNSWMNIPNMIAAGEVNSTNTTTTTSSSFGGNKSSSSSFWPELLYEDPFMHDL